jgi:hypothetical protein
MGGTLAAIAAGFCPGFGAIGRCGGGSINKNNNNTITIDIN